MAGDAQAKVVDVGADFRPKRNPDVAEKIGSITMLFDAAAGRLFELNETGKSVWVMCDGRRTVSEIAEALGAEYEGSPSEMLKDVSSFVAKMLELNLLM